MLCQHVLPGFREGFVVFFASFCNCELMCFRSGLHWKLAYTPLYSFLSAGQMLDCKGLVLAMYCFSMRIPQDAAPLMIGRGHKYVDLLYKKFRHACAFRMMRLNMSTQFTPGIIEWDGLRSSGRRNRREQTVTHVGRFLIGCHRTSWPFVKAGFSLTFKGFGFRV